MTDDERYEILAASHATLERAGATLASHAANPSPIPEAPLPKIVPEWWRHKTTTTMSSLEFRAWIDAGQPALWVETRQAEPAPPREPGLTAADVDRRMEAMVSAIGREVAKIESLLETRLRSEIAALRDELRAEIAVVRTESRAANELADMKRQIEILRSDRVRDLQAEPRRATGQRAAP